MSRNGVHSGEHERTRVEVPRDGDQLKLSELFNVLRIKKPDSQAQQETQVRRVTSRRISESDSDSSSNSDVEVRSTALSMTESELDTRRAESPRLVESPLHTMVESEQELEVASDHSSDYKVHVKPIPAPRSPIPAVRRKMGTFDSPDSSQPTSPVPIPRSPVPKPRSPRPTSENGDQAAMSEHKSSKNTAHNTDNVSIHSNLSAHVVRTKESLEIKHEVEKSRSENSLNTTETEQVVRPKTKNGEKLVASDVKGKVRPHSEQLQRSENELDNLINQNGKARPSSEHLTKLSNQNLQRVIDDVSNTTAEINQTSELLVPRTGSPYSFSMDSLPSSHPSPSMRRVSFNSNQELSDTDSLSRMSQGDSSDHSGTQSSLKDGVQEDYVVEEISKVRFRRVSKGQLHVAQLAKMSKSPNRSKSFTSSFLLLWKRINLSF